MRILSPLPSATEIAFLLGLADQLTAVSHECDFPPAALGKRKVVCAVDGHGYCSRSGPRLVDGLEILAHLVHPELFPGPIPAGALERIHP